MKHQFKNKNILVVNSDDSPREMLASILRLQGVANVDQAATDADAYTKFKDINHDTVIAALTDGASDAISLARNIRGDSGSPDRLTPVIATMGTRTLHLVEAARDVGVTDLLRAPYTVDDVAERLDYVFGLNGDALKKAAEPQAPPMLDKPSAEDAESWPDEEEGASLTDMLLDHYLRHHEVVLKKLKFAQSATKQCIEEIRNVHEKMRDRDNTNIHEFTDFDKMWEDIIGLFVDGGLSEDELFKIESLITTVPQDIKIQYDSLSQQDKSFLALVESMNSIAYKKAKERVMKLQSRPSPLTGRVPVVANKTGIEVRDDSDEESGAFIYEPVRKK